MDSHLSARDPQLVLNIVNHLKSQGFFDQFRRECLADVDTKPSFQNLRQRVEGYVSKFLSQQTWKPELNKNMLRDSLRKQINDSGMLSIGVEHVVDQVVNPKVSRTFLPQIETIVRQYLGLEHPSEPVAADEKLEEQKENVKKENILPPDPIAKDVAPKAIGKAENIVQFEKSLEAVRTTASPDTPKKEPENEGPLPLAPEEKTTNIPTTGKLLEALASTDTTQSVDIKSNIVVVVQVEDSVHETDSVFSNIHPSTESGIKSPISQDNTSLDFGKLDGMRKESSGDAPVEVKIKEEIQKPVATDITNERAFVFDDNSVSCADSNDGEKLIINEDSLMSDLNMESDSREQSNSRPEVKQEISNSSDKECSTVKTIAEEARTDFQNFKESSENDATLDNQQNEESENKKESGELKDGKSKKDVHRKYDKDRLPSKHKHSEQTKSKHSSSSSSKNDPKHKSSSKPRDSEKHKHESTSKSSAKTDSKTPKSHSDHKSKSSSSKSEHKHKSHSSSKTVEKSLKPSEGSSSKPLSSSKSDKHDSEKKSKSSKDDSSGSKKKSFTSDSKDHKLKSSSHSGSKSSKILDEKSKKLSTHGESKSLTKSSESCKTQEKSRGADSSKHAERSRSSDKTKHKDYTSSKGDGKHDKKGESSSSKDRSKPSKHEEKKSSHTDPKKEGSIQEVPEKTSSSDNSNSGDSCVKQVGKNKDNEEVLTASPKSGLEKVNAETVSSVEINSDNSETKVDLNEVKEDAPPSVLKTEEVVLTENSEEVMKCENVNMESGNNHDCKDKSNMSKPESVVDVSSIDDSFCNKRESDVATPLIDEIDESLHSKRESDVATPLIDEIEDPSFVKPESDGTPTWFDEISVTKCETDVSKSLNDESSELKPKLAGADLSNDEMLNTNTSALSDESSNSVCIIEINSDSSDDNKKSQLSLLEGEKDNSEQCGDVQSSKSDMDQNVTIEVRKEGNGSKITSVPLTTSDDDNDDKSKDNMPHVIEVRDIESDEPKEDLMKSIILQKSDNESGSILAQLGHAKDSKQEEDDDAKSESISSVHTSDLSDYEDKINLSSSDELEAVESVNPEVKQKKVPLKEIKEVTATYMKSRTNSSGRSTPIFPSGDDDTNQSAFKQRLEKTKSEMDGANKPESAPTEERQHSDDEDGGVRTSSRFGRQRKANPKYASEEYIVDSSWKDSDHSPAAVASTRRSTRKSVEETSKPKTSGNTPEPVPSSSAPVKMSCRKRLWSKTSDKISEEGTENVSENEKKGNEMNVEKKKSERKSSETIPAKYRRKGKGLSDTIRDNEKKRETRCSESSITNEKESEKTVREVKGAVKEKETEIEIKNAARDVENEKKSYREIKRERKRTEKDAECEMGSREETPENERKSEGKQAETNAESEKKSREKMPESERKSEGKQAEKNPERSEKKSRENIPESERKSERKRAEIDGESDKKNEKKATNSEKRGREKSPANERKSERKKVENDSERKTTENERKNERKGAEKYVPNEKKSERRSTDKVTETEKKGEGKTAEQTDESSSSVERRSTSEEVQTRSRRKTISSSGTSPETGKHSLNLLRSESQRYSSADLYKPRPVIGSRRHRTNEEAPNTESNQEKRPEDQSQTKKGRGRPRKRPLTPPPKPPPFVKRKRH